MIMTTRRGPRSPRADTKQETRVALITAALTEFAEHGLDAPSLDAICARAGYTRGAFYVHFRDRGDLMTAVVEHAMSTFLEAVIAHGDEAHDLERTIERFAAAIVDTIGVPRRSAAPALPLPANVPFARVLEAVTRNPGQRERFAAVLVRAVVGVEEVAAHGQRAGTVRGDVDAAHVGALLVLVALGVMVAIDVSLPLDPAGLQATVRRMIAPSVAPSGGARKTRRRVARETRGPVAHGRAT
jgi:AcrR family transcriptional regulator